MNGWMVSDGMYYVYGKWIGRKEETEMVLGFDRDGKEGMYL